MRKFVMVGTGKVGLTLARALRAYGFEQIGFVSRSQARGEEVARQEGVASWSADIGAFASEAEWIFLAVPDSYIASVCEALVKQGHITSRHTMVHFSGALTSEELQIASAKGAKVLSMHPLRSFANGDDLPLSLQGILFTLEGNRDAIKTGAAIVETIQGVPFTITKAQKVLYHAGAVVASNYLVALSDLATSMLNQVGIPREYGLPGLMALSQGVLDNIKKHGPIQALTGPVARGDIYTVKKHLGALETMPEWQELYKVLGAYTVGLAQTKGTIDVVRSQELMDILG